MRIAFVIFSLSGGGAERVASTLVNYWANAGDQVTLVTIDSSDSDFYSLDSRVMRIALDLRRRSRNWAEFVRNNVQRVRHLRKVIRACEPDVVVSFLDTTNVLVLLASLGLGVPIVVSERTDPRRHSLSRIPRWLRRLVYPLAGGLVVQTHDVGSWARQIVCGEAVYVIPNPVAQLPADFCRSDETKRRRTAIAIGRIDFFKGFDLLLAAFACCSEKHPDWSLRIIGDGPERERLTMLAAELGLEHRFRLDGIVKEPNSILHEADLFVLSSRYEGFPNALLEAMACGLPVISFDCPSGPREIIRDGIDGVLVPPGDVEALANAMDRLMGTEQERRRLGARAVEVCERFSVSRVMAMWQDVLDGAVGKRSGRPMNQANQGARRSERV